MCAYFRVCEVGDRRGEGAGDSCVYGFVGVFGICSTASMNFLNVNDDELEVQCPASI